MSPVITKQPVVKLGSATLKPGADYDVAYEDNVAVGTATVTITGKGNYAGTKSATFEIAAALGTPQRTSGPADARRAAQEAAAAKAAAAKVGGVPAAESERAITTAKSDADPKGSTFSLLRAKSTKQTRKAITLKWSKVKGASGYTVYANKCGKGNKYMKLADLKGRKLVVKKAAGKKLKKGTYYKFLVVSWQSVDGHKVVTATSKTLHVATKGGKVGNYKSVKLSKRKATLKKGGKLKLRARQVAASKKLKVKRHRKVKFESSNPKVAKVSGKGVVKARGKGTCYVYAYSQSGSFAKCKVTVR